MSMQYKAISKILAVPLRRSVMPFLVLVLSMFFGCSARERHTSFRPVPIEFTPLTPIAWQLPNGLRVLYFEDREVPLVRGTLYIKGGALGEPADQPGIYSALGDQMRRGGAGSLNAEDLDKLLEERAAGISSAIGAEFGKVSFSCLSEDLDEVFGLFVDVLQRPRFEQSRLDIWKGQTIEAIRRRADEPDIVAAQSFAQLVYLGSQLGRPVLSPDILKISHKALIAAHKHYLQPQGAILTIVGPVARAKVAELTERYLAKVPAQVRSVSPMPALGAGAKPRLYFVRGEFEQATIRLGHLGVPRLTSDYPQIALMNEIFGAGGFSSRLMKRIRTDLGLAYSVYGGIFPGAIKGSNFVAVQTKAETAAQAISEAVLQINELRARPVDADELDQAQRTIANSFVFKFDSYDKTLERLAILDLYSFPVDYDQRYLEHLAAQSPASLQASAIERWSADRLIIVVVGNENAYNSALTLVQPSAAFPLGIEVVRREFSESLAVQDDDKSSL